MRTTVATLTLLLTLGCRAQADAGDPVADGSAPEARPAPAQEAQEPTDAAPTEGPARFRPAPRVPSEPFGPPEEAEPEPTEVQV